MSLSSANGLPPVPTTVDELALISGPQAPIHLVITADAEYPHMRLVVPRRLLTTTESPSVPQQAPWPASRHPGSWPTSMAGAALAAAFLLGGLWLARRRPSGPLAVGACVIAGLLVAAGFAAANMPPVEAWWTEGRANVGLYQVVVSDHADVLELHLTKSQFQALGIRSTGGIWSGREDAATGLAPGAGRK